MALTRKPIKAIVGGLAVSTVIAGSAFFAAASPGMDLNSSFANSNEHERVSLLAGGKWNFEQLVCPYSTAEFTRSELLGLPGSHTKYIASDSTAAIIYRKGTSDDVYVVTFSRTSEFDPCSSE